MPPLATTPPLPAFDRCSPSSLLEPQATTTRAATLPRTTAFDRHGHFSHMTQLHRPQTAVYGVG
jgi:hypothetical protein